MNSDTRVYGNLALAPDRAPRFTVVEGSSHRKIVASASRQVFAPAVYARSRAPQVPNSIFRSYLLGLVGIVVASAILAIFIVGTGDFALKDAVSNTPMQIVEVGAGDSLWQIAESHSAHGLSTAETVELIRVWNDLDSAMLVPGMELAVPGSQG